VAAEDTRQAGKLLAHFGIKAALVSFHQHNEAERIAEILQWSREGKTVAVVSDAGMPGISDPGQRLVRQAADEDAALTVLPGANAAITGLVLSGLPTEQFFYGGFLPRKTSERQKALEAVRSLEATLVFYEAPHRLLQCMEDLHHVLGDRQAAICRELTKWHEESRRGKLSSLYRYFTENKPRGELVVLVQGRVQGKPAHEGEKDVRRAVLDEMEAGASKKEAVKSIARRLGKTRNEVYQEVLDLPTHL